MKVLAGYRWVTAVQCAHLMTVQDRFPPFSSDPVYSAS